MRTIRAALARASVVLAVLVLVPSAAFAQATITGIVKDTSGAVLPGVTVEAASPVLIERARSTVTDASGQFRIVDLRTGTYSVTFSLPGFSTVKRDGIELSGAFVAVVNADLKVGTLQETIVVTGETPIVDVQSTARQTTMDNELIICAGASPTPSCSPTSAPETGALRDVGQRIQQARWTSPQTNRLLFEAGFGTYMSRWGGEPMPGADPNLIRTPDQCTTGAGIAGPRQLHRAEGGRAGRVYVPQRRRCGAERQLRGR
ncbi:MAG TPA: carboxypeptidase-like regulatory domain-containing protein [Vicinamibacterales bacterium]|nr:carboxypeptidase-like regulatory domain-containing protein [Vicinamibacterales bacterium]